MATALASGCLYGLAAVPLLMAGGGGGGKNTPPTVLVVVPAREVGGTVTFTVTVFDPESDPADLALGFTEGAGSWQAATIASSTGGIVAGNAVRGLPATPEGMTYTVVWDSAADFPAAPPYAHTDLRLRLQPSDGTLLGPAVTSAAFVAGNDAPTLALSTPGSPQSGLTQIDYTITDTTSDFASLAPEYYRPSSGTWQAATVTAGELTMVTSSPAGVAHALIWSSLADLGSVNVTGVQFRLTAQDTLPGLTVPTGAFDVRNNEAPIAFIGSPVLRDVRESAVPISYFLLDGNADLLDIQPLWSTDGSTWTAATEDTTSLASEGTTGLASSSTGVAHTFVWASALDLPGQDIQTVLFRIIPSDASGPGLDFRTEAFWLNNNSEPTATIARFSGIQQGNVSVRYTLRDTEGDLVSVTPRYSTDGGATYQPMTEATGAGSEGTAGLTSSTSGVKHAFVWDSAADIAGDAALVIVSYVPQDHPVTVLGQGPGDVEILSIYNAAPNPGVRTIRTLDDDGDGVIDLVRIEFNQGVDDSTYDPALISDASGLLPLLGGANPLADAGGGDGPVSEVDQADDPVIYVRVNTAALPVDTGRLPDIVASAGFVAGLTAIPSFGVSGAFVIEDDGARPVMTNITTDDTNGNGRVDRLTVVYSEPVNVTDGLSSDGLTGFSVTNGFTVSPADYQANGVATLTLIIGGGPFGTDLTPTLLYTAGAGTVRDAAFLEEVAGDSLAATDGAGPVILQATYQDTGTRTIADDTILVTFSEPIDDASLAFLAGTDFQPQGSLRFGSDGTTDPLPAASNQITIRMGTTGGGAAFPAPGDTVLATGGGILDLLGNGSPASGLPAAIGGGLGPRVVSVRTMDEDQDGQVDRLRIQFDRAVTDSTFDIFGSGAQAGALVLAGSLLAPVSEVDTANDAVIYAEIQESGPNTGTAGDLTTTGPGLVTGTNGIPAVRIDSADAVETDGAPPRISAARTQDASPADGRIDGVLLTFSELVDIIDVVGVADGLPAFTVSGYTIAPFDYSLASTTTLLLQLEPQAAADTQATPAVAYQTADGTAVEASGPLEVPEGDAEPSSDGAPPHTEAAVTRDVNGDGRIDRITLTYSEPIVVADAGGAGNGLPAYTLSDGFDVAPGNYSAAGLTLTLDLVGGPAADTAITPDISYAPDGTTRDASPAANEAAADTFAGTADGAGPVVVRALHDSANTPVDPSDDEIDVLFSEAVADASLGASPPIADLLASAGWTLGSATLDTGTTADDARWVVLLSADSTAPAIGTDTLGAAATEVADAAGNTSPAGAAAAIEDGTPPGIASATTGDADGNGRTDRITIVFTEDTTGTAAPADWSVAGRTVSAVDQVDSLTFRLTLVEAGFDTETTPAVGYTPGDLADGDGNLVDPVIGFPTADGAPPVLVALATLDDDGDGKVDTLVATFSESVVDATYDPSLAAMAAFTLLGGVDPLRDGADAPTSVADAANDATLYIEIVPGASPDTGLLGDFTTTAAGLADDPQGLAAPTVTSGSIVEADGAAPVVVEARYDRRGTVGVASDDVLTLRFSESIDDLTLDPAGNPVADMAPTGTFSFGTASLYLAGTVNDDTITVDLGADATEAVAPPDTVAILAGAVADLAGNAAIAGNDPAPLVFTGSGPQTISIATLDSNADGTLDLIRITFDRAVLDASYVDVATVTGLAATTAALAYPVGDAVNDAVIHWAVTSPGPDTGTVPDVTYPSGLIQEVGSGIASLAVGSSFTETDAARPVPGHLLASPVPPETADLDGDGDIDAIRIAYSEPVGGGDITAGTNWSISLGHAAAAGGSVAGSVATIIISDTGAGSGETPTVAYLGGAGNVQDAAGNLANPFAATATADRAAPAIRGALTADANANGQVDRVTLTYSEPVTVADAGGAGDGLPAFAIGGAFAVAAGNYAGGPSATLVLNLTGGPAADTAVRPSVTYTQDGVTARDTAANEARAQTLTEASAGYQDGAAPVLASAATDDSNGDGTVDRVSLGFTEAVNVADAGGAGDGLPAFTLTGGFFLTAANYTGGPSTTLVLGLSGGPAGDTSAAPSVTYTPDGATLRDPAANELLATTRASSDGAAPRILAAVTADTNGDARVDRVTLTWSEPVTVQDAGGAGDGLPAFTLTAGFSVAAGNYAGGPSATLVLGLSGGPAGDTAVAPSVTYTRDGSTARDTASNEAANQSFAGTTDGARPAVTAALTADTNGDGRVDRVTLTYSEAVTIADAGGGADGLPAFTLTDGFAVATGNYAGGPSATLILALSGGPAADTAVTPDVTYTPDGQTVRDAAPSEAAAQTFTGTADGAAPVATAAQTGDASEDGQVDLIDVAFTEALAGVSTAGWSVAGPARTVSTASQPVAGTVRLGLTPGGAPDTAITPTVSYAPGALADGSGNAVAAFGPLASEDRAPPVLVTLSTFDDDGDGIVDTLIAAFSEPIQDATYDPSLDLHTAFTLAGGADPLRDAPGDAPVNAADTANDDTVYIELVEGATADTGLVGDFTTTAAGLVQDPAANLAPPVTVAGLDETDGAPPAIVRATYDQSGTPLVVGDDLLTVRFSEPIADSSLDAGGAGGNPSFDFQAGGTLAFGDSLTQSGTANDDVVVIDLGAGATQPVIPGDTIRILPAQVTGILGNPATAWNLARSLEYTSGPTVLSITTLDPNSDGTLDYVRIVFDRAVSDGSYDNTKPVVSGPLAVNTAALVYPAGDAVDDAVIHWAATSPGPNTGALPQVTWAADMIRDLSAIACVALDASFAETDGARPIPGHLLATAVPAEALDTTGDGDIDAIRITFSEPVTGGDITAGTGWTVSGGHAGTSGGSVAANVATIRITDTGGGSAETPTIAYTSGGAGTVRDTSAAANPLASFAAAATIDRARPAMVAAQSQDADADGRVDRLAITFSETVAIVDSGGLGNGLPAFTLSNGFTVANDDYTSAATATLTLKLANGPAGDTSVLPQVTYTQDGQTVRDISVQANEASAQTFTGTADGAKPVITQAVTNDANADGRVDRITLTFSEQVNITDAGGAGNGLPAFTLSNGFAVANANYAGGPQASLVLQLSGGPANDTGVLPSVTYTPDGTTIRDPSLNEAQAQAFAGTQDGAKPLVTAAVTADANGDGRVDRVTLTYSEQVTVTDAGGAGDGLPAFTLTNGFTVAAGNYAGGPSATLALNLSSGPANDTAVLPSVTYAPNGTARDAASNDAVAQTFAGTTDGAAPVITAAATGDANSNGQIDRLAVTWSEPVTITDSGGAGDGLPAFSFTGGFVIPTGSYAAAASATHTLVHGGGPADDTAIKPSVTYAQVGSTIRDAASIEAPAQAFAATADAAPPVPRQATTGESDRDGVLEFITVRFSETVGGALSAVNWTVASPARTVTGASQPGATNEIRVTFTESGVPDSGVSPQVSYAPGSVADTAGNALAAFGPLASTDGARPVLTALRTMDDTGDGIVDTLVATFSEPVIDSGYAPAQDSLSVFTLTGGTDPLRNVAGPVNDPPANAADTANDEVVYIELNPAGSANTGSIGDFTAGFSLVSDAAGNGSQDIGSADVTERDGAAPAIFQASYDRAGTIGSVADDLLTLVFSESISDASLDLGGAGGNPTLDFQPQGTLAFGTNSLTLTGTANDNQVTIDMGSTATVPVAGDTIRILTGAVADLATTPNTASSWNLARAIAFTGTGPVTQSITTLDTNGDGTLDYVRIVFDRAVQDSSYANVATVTGLAVNTTVLALPAGDAANDATIHWAATAPGPNTGVVPDVTYPAGMINEVGTGLASTAVGPALTETDGARPVPGPLLATPVANETGDQDGDGAIDAVKIAFSENIAGTDITTGTNWSFSGSHVGQSGGAIAGNVATVRISEVGTNSGETPTVQYLGGGGGAIRDTSTAQNAANPFGPHATTDKVRAVITSIMTADMNTDGRVDMVTVGYSELMNFSDPGLATDGLPGYSFSDGFTIPNRDYSGIVGTSITIFLGGGLANNTSIKPSLTYAASGTTVDQSGNEATAQTVASTFAGYTDGAAPILVARRTADTNSNGRIDRLRLDFTEAVNIVDGNAGNGLPDYVISGGYTIANRDYQATGISTLELWLVELGVDDTNATPAATYSAAPTGTTRDAALNQEPASDGGAVVTTDQAPPVFTARTDDEIPIDGHIDLWVMSFSEPVNVTDAGGAADGLPALAITGYSQVAFNYTAAGATQVSLRLSPLGAFDTGATPVGTYTANGSIKDVAGNEVPTGLARTPTDSAPPFISAARTRDTNLDGRIDRLQVDYSETVNVADSGGAADGLPDFAVTGYGIQSKNYAASGVASLNLDLVPGGTSDTNATPQLSYGGAVAVTVADPAAIEADTQTVTALDEAAPVILSSETRDNTGNGRIDEIRVTASENLAGSGAGFTVAGYTISSSSLAANQVTLNLAEGGAADSGNRPNVTYDSGPGTLADAAANQSPSYGPTQAQDKAGPVIVSAQYNRLGSSDVANDELTLTFSEAIDAATLDVSAGGAANDYNLSGNIAFGVNSTGSSVAADKAKVVMGAGATALGGGGGSVSIDPLAIADGAGNQAPAANPSVAIVDVSAPFAISVRTLDQSGDGKVDLYEVTFSQAVTDSTYDPATGNPQDQSGQLSLPGSLGVRSGDVANDATIYLYISEAGYNTDVVGNLIFNAGLIEAGTTPCEALTGAGVTEQDGAPPRLVGSLTRDADGNGRIDRIELTFSEPVNVSDPGGATDGLVDFSVGAPYGIANFDYTVSGQASFQLRLVEGGSADTAATPTVTYADGGTPSVEDVVGNDLPGSGRTTTDGAGPVIVRAQYDNKGNGVVADDTIDITFSEGISRTTIDTTPGGANTDFIEGGTIQFGAASQTDTGGNDDEFVRITMGVGATPPNLNGDTLKIATGEIQDTRGNGAASNNVPRSIEDAAPFNLTAVETQDLDGNGRIDALRLTWNQPVNEATYDVSKDFSTVLTLSESVLSDASTTDQYVSVKIEENQGSNTGALTDFTATAGLVQSTGGALSPAISSGTVVETDKAPPRAVTRETQDVDADGHIDRIRLVMSEDVMGVAVLGWTVTGYTITSASEPSAGEVRLELSEILATYDTGQRPATSYDATLGNLTDLASNELPSTGALTPDDKAPPIAYRAELLDTDPDGSLDQVHFFVSESVSDATVVPAGFTLATSAGTGFVSGTPNDAEFDIKFSSAVLGTGLQQVTYDAATGQVKDLAAPPNAMPSIFAAVNIEVDMARPVPVGAARYIDANVDSSFNAFDQVIVSFSEDLVLYALLDTGAFQVPVSGDSLGLPSAASAGTRANEVVVPLGTGVTFRLRGDFNSGALMAGKSSGIGVSAGAGSDIADSAGNDAVAGIYVDIAPSPRQAVDLSKTDQTLAVALADVDVDGDLDVIEGNSTAGGGAANTWRANSNGTGSYPTTNSFGNSRRTTSMALADFDRDGDLDLAAGNNASGSEVTEIYRFVRPSPNSFESTPGTTLVAADTRSLAAADVDRDGDPDIIQGNSGTLKVFPNTSTTAAVSFGSASSYGLDTNQALAVADFNGDGKLDIVAGTPTTLRRWTGNGTIAGFTDAGTFGTTGDTRALGVGDFNRDGVLDLVAGRVGSPGLVFFGVRDNFSFTDSGQSLNSQDTQALVVVDWDIDGDLDVVCADPTQGITFFLNDGAGQLRDAGWRIRGDTTDFRSIAAGDVDRDGDPDLLLGAGPGQWNRIYRNDFSPWRKAYPYSDPYAGGGPLSGGPGEGVAMADLDEDGILDLVIARSGNAVSYIYHGKASGPGNFENGDTVSMGSTETTGAQDVEVVDLDADGDLDLIFVGLGVNSGIYIFWNGGQFTNGTGSIATRFAATPDLTFSGTGVYDVAIGDIEPDGDLDMVTSRGDVLKANGPGNFSGSSQVLGVGSCYGVALGDIDNEGDLDVVTNERNGGSSDGKRFIFDRTGGSYGAATVYSAVNSVAAGAEILLLDINRSGDLEAVVAQGASASIGLFNLVPDSTFSPAAPASTDWQHGLGAGDLDQDGDLDLVVGQDVDPAYFLRNDGSGALTLDPDPDVAAAANPTARFADIDRDGDLDVVLGTAAGVSYYLNELP